MPPRNAMIDAMANALDTGVGAQGVRNKMAQEYGAMYDPRYSDFPSTGMNIGSQTPYGGQWGGMSSPVIVDAGITQADVLGGWGPTQNYEGTPLYQTGVDDYGMTFPPMNIGGSGYQQMDPGMMNTGLPVGYPPNASGYYVSGKETDEYIPFYSDEKGLAGVVPYANDREFVPSPDHTGTQVSVPVSHGGPDGSQASCPVGYTYDPEVGACVMQGVSEKMQGLEGQNKMELIRNPELLKIFLQKMTPAKPSQGMPPVPEGLRGMLGTQTPQQAPQLPQQMSEAPQQGRQG